MLCCRLSVRGVCFASALLAATAVYADAPDKKAADGDVKAKPLGVAHIEVKGSYPDSTPAPGLFGEISEGLSAAIARLDKAAADENITSVILQIDSPSLGWARMNDFRQAIGRVRAKGKRVHAYLDSGMTMHYLLATACDEIVMPESGMLVMTGLRAEVSFYKNLLDMVNVKAEMLRVGEYKSAAEPYSRTEMSKEFREEMDALLDDLYGLMVETIAEGRKLDKEKVKSIINDGPFTAGEAKKRGLIDRLAYPDEIEAGLKKSNPGREVKITRKYGKKKLDTDFSGFAGLVKMMNLLMGEEPQARPTKGPKIAVIHATGPIMSGKSSSSLLGEETMGSDTIIKAIESAKKDNNVKAIVLRVNSPGGSALASDLMWRALGQSGKIVIVSMGDVAASGGYYISMGADRIFAEPGTITGSIGVVGGKIALKGLYEKIGITTTVLSRGKNSGALSTTEPFTDSERQAMQKMLNDIYDQFTKKAAAGRKMEHEKLEKLARGRIYSGRRAKELGLVDEIGTLEDAIAYAAKEAGLEGDKYERLQLPKPTSPFESLIGPIDGDAAARARQAAVQDVLRGLSPELADQLRGADVMTLLSKEPRLTVMPFRIVVK